MGTDVACRGATRLSSILLLLPISLTACGGDDTPDQTWRLPCGSTTVDDTGTVLVRTSFTYDDARHLLAAESRGSDGSVVATTTQAYENGKLKTTERVTTATHTLTTLTWDGDNLVQGVRDDLILDNGDSGYTWTNTFDGDAQVTQRWAWHDPARGATLTTITGDRSAEATWRSCPEPANGDPCDVSVYTQPDSDPANWTVGRTDWGEDGAIDYELIRTIDTHDLELTFEWADFDLETGARLLQQRDHATREADGTALEYVYESFDNGTPTFKTTETNEFTCAAARIGDIAAGGATAATAHEVRMPDPLPRRWQRGLPRR